MAGKEGFISGCDETESNLPRVADSKRNRCLSRSKSGNLDHAVTTLCMVLSEMLPRKRNREKIAFIKEYENVLFLKRIIKNILHKIYPVLLKLNKYIC